MCDHDFIVLEQKHVGELTGAIYAVTSRCLKCGYLKKEFRRITK